MKKITLTLSAAVALVALTIVGCSTTPNSAQTNALEQFAITSAASLGTAELLQQYPQYRPDFVVAEAVLAGISTGTNTLTAPQVSALLNANGVTNAMIAAIIVNGITLADTYAANGTNATFQQYVGWINLGISQNLGATFKRK